MNDSSDDILDIFQKQNYVELATTDLIKQCYPEEYAQIKSALHDPHSTKEAKAIAKRRKGTLHRRILYHLGNLIQEHKIIVNSIKGRGEKYYILSEQHTKKENHHNITPPTNPLGSLESYQQEGIITTLDKQGWHQRLNAILLLIQKNDTCEHLAERLETIGPYVNDAIGIYGTEELIVKENLQTITTFIKQIDIETRDNNKRITLNIDTSNITDSKQIENFIQAFSLIKPKNINILFSTNEKFIENHQRFIKNIIREFSKQTIKINLHNNTVHKAPAIIGRAGMYTMKEKEWEQYLAEDKENTIGLCMGHMSIGIDVRRFFSTYKQNAAFRVTILKLAKTIAHHTTQQRRRNDMDGSPLITLNKKPRSFFKYTTNYIRLWNYDWKEEQHQHFMELLQSTCEELEQFCTTQETIYKSCGLPIRFNIELGSMFAKFEQKFFSKRHYQKFTTNNLATLQREDFRTFITAREKIAQQFHHNDRMRIFRSTPTDPDEAYKEIMHLFHEYSVAHITYDFSERKINMTLDQYMQG
jgi:sulfur relay (sulfurtransferase) DsrC/TusE family protein